MARFSLLPVLDFLESFTQASLFILLSSEYITNWETLTFFFFFNFTPNDNDGRKNKVVPKAMGLTLC